jgi:uncharacterized protein YfdQ (DUF2303 family)
MTDQNQLADLEFRQATQVDLTASVIARLGRLAAAAGGRVIKTDKGAAVLLESADGGEVLQFVGENREMLGGLPMVAPGRIQETIHVETVDSLIDYANTFKAKNSLFLASISSSVIVGLLDYHTAEREGDEPAVFTPDFVEHRVTLGLPHSTEWDIWKRLDGKLMPQNEFVSFLDENREDIVRPDAATMLEAVMDMQSLRKVDFRSAARLDTEHLNIEYADEVDAKTKPGGVVLPTSFDLEIPVYFDGQLDTIQAVLRWKLEDGGKLFLGYILKRAERVRQARFKAIMTEVAEQTGVSALYGSLR